MKLTISNQPKWHKINKLDAVRQCLKRDDVRLDLSMNNIFSIDLEINLETCDFLIKGMTKREKVFFNLISENDK